MPKYTVRADVTVDVIMEIDAPSEAGALSIFNEHIAMSAFLSDCDEGDDYFVEEDSISKIRNLEAEEVKQDRTHERP